MLEMKTLVSVTPGGEVIFPRHVEREKVRVGSTILLHGKLDPGIKLVSGTMPGWTIIRLNICSPGCISFLWIKERWWAR